MKNGLDLFYSEMRSTMQQTHRKAIADGTLNLEESLARAWHELPEAEKQDYQMRFEVIKKQNADAEKEGVPIPAVPRQVVFDGESRGGSTVATAEDEDVEMGDEVEAPAEGGFTAVNRD